MAPLLAAAIPTLIDLVPDAVGWLGGDKAEKAADDMLGIAKNVTGLGTKDEALGAIQSDPDTALKFKMAVMNDKYRFDEMYLADKANARDMQKEALKQEDKFSKRFLYYLASAWSIFAMSYITAISFITIPETSIRFVDTITGFLLGTIVSGIIQFFFGSSKGSKDKQGSQDNIVELLRDYREKEKNNTNKKD